jgi:hypothetical protein
MIQEFGDGMAAVGAEVAGDERGACSMCLSRVMPTGISSRAIGGVFIDDVVVGDVKERNCSHCQGRCDINVE